MVSMGQGFGRDRSVLVGVSHAAVVDADLGWDHLKGCFTLISGARLGRLDQRGAGTSGVPWASLCSLSADSPA